MTVEEIKLRRLAGQFLTAPADKLTVVRGLCGVQAQFLSNALHALKIRCTGYDEGTVGDGLVKNWTIRDTVHVFAEEDLPLFLTCSGGRDYRRNEWSDASFWNQRESWALTPERQAYFSQVILDALAGGPRTRDELKELCRAKGMTGPEEGSMFEAWGGGIRELCERGFLHYAVEEKKVFCLSPEFTPLPEEEAGLELARRYFTNFGPATVHDAMYFFRATAAQVKGWISRLPVRSFDCGGRTYYAIEHGRPWEGELPRCLFLAGFDQLMLGYEKKESLFLAGEDLRAVFNLAGIVMPALLLDGRVAGTWKKKGRKLSIRPLRPLGAAERAAIGERAEFLWGGLTKLEYVT